MLWSVYTDALISLYICFDQSVQPASVAQLAARPTGDQEVAGLTPARLATFFPRDWS